MPQLPSYPPVVLHVSDLCTLSTTAAAVSEYVSLAESASYLHPDALLTPSGVEFSARGGLTGGLVLHQLRRVDKGLRGERLLSEEGVQEWIEDEEQTRRPQQEDEESWTTNGDGSGKRREGDNGRNHRGDRHQDQEQQGGWSLDSNMNGSTPAQWLHGQIHGPGTRGGQTVQEPGETDENKVGGNDVDVDDDRKEGHGRRKEGYALTPATLVTPSSHEKDQRRTPADPASTSAPTSVSHQVKTSERSTSGTKRPSSGTHGTQAKRRTTAANSHPSGSQVPFIISQEEAEPHGGSLLAEVGRRSNAIGELDGIPEVRCTAAATNGTATEKKAGGPEPDRTPLTNEEKDTRKRAKKRREKARKREKESGSGIMK